VAGSDQRVRVKRIYAEASSGDGARVLVDRVWPRGVKKEGAGIDEWVKGVAPSTGLRRWYGHEVGRFAEFRRRYLAELADEEHRGGVERLRELVAAGPVTLLTATRDVEHSQAAVLAEWLGGDQ
jgi:uncharacterized protein YeaO (DUF488 family)